MEKLVNVCFGDKNVNEYSVVVLRKTEAAQYAASELLKYFSKIGIHLSLSYTMVQNPKIILDFESDKIKKDKFSIFFEDEDLYLSGRNPRSLIYAVYEFLERIGWRFFAPQSSYRGVERGAHMLPCEKFIGENNVLISRDLKIEQEAVFGYRDGSSFVTRTEEEFCAKLRLNAETWDYHKFGERLGGAVHFAGIHGHTFERLLPLSRFAESYPEFYAEIEGKRRTYGERLDAPQYCLSNFESVPYVAESVKELLRKYPDAGYVSVSQNDSKLHCQCENCKKSYEKYGNFGTLIRYVNKVAEIVEKEFPDVYIHTFVYEWSTQNFKTNVKARKNVLAQWCPVDMCRNHSLNDEKCSINRHWYAQLKNISVVCENVFIYDYRSCLKYAMLQFTDIFTLRDTMQTYAECNVKGIYSELCLHTYNQPNFEELRSYLFGKLTWNPYMNQEEYERHICEFLQAYYGEGWRYIYEYLKVWSNINPDLHYTSFHSTVFDDNGFIAKTKEGKNLEAYIVKEEELSQTIKILNELLDKASKVGLPEHKGRIEIVRTGLIWYELYHTMSSILENGTEQERKDIIVRNRDLCSRMRKYQMKYTTYIGMGSTTYMYEDFSLSPDQWRYTGETNPNKKIFL